MEVPGSYCTPFHESSNRPHLLSGCDPTALGISFVTCVVIGYSYPKWWFVILAACLFFVLRAGLRHMAKQDPLMLTVHFEAQRYNQGFWTAKPRNAARWSSK